MQAGESRSRHARRHRDNFATKDKMKFSVLAAVVPTVLAAPVRVPMKKRSDEEFKIVRRAQAVTQAAQRGDTGSITIKDYSNAQVSPFPLSLAADFARTYIFSQKKS